MEGNILVERAEMAGHLLAELYNARELWREGKLTEAQFVAVIQRGRRRMRSGTRGNLYHRGDTRMPRQS